MHDLDPKALTEAFAARGLVCSVLSPQPGEDVDLVAGQLVPAARRADLLVFDWVLNNDDGETALELIGRVLSEDSPEHGRLRVIAIYTGQDDLAGVAQALKDRLSDHYADCDLIESSGGLTFTKGPLRVIVLAKGDVDLPPGLETRAVVVADLPARLIAEFAEIASGLVSGVALKALAALRFDAHRIIEALGSDLDAAYLGHRVAQRSPDDAQGHLVSLVASEIRAVLDDHEVGRVADMEAAKRWMRAARKRGVKFGELVDGKPLTAPTVHRYLSRGLGTDARIEEENAATQVSKARLKAMKSRATELFTTTELEAQISNVKLSERMAMRTHYLQPRRTLQLGTVVSSGADYLLCVQPVCDSIRLSGVVEFPFLRMTTSETPEGADFHFYQEGGEVNLRLAGSPSALRMLPFEAGPSETVAARKRGDAWFFVSTRKPRSWRWVGELKPEFAQRVAVELAQSFSRVGLDEHELLRRPR